MTSAAPTNGKHPANAHASRRIPIGMNGHAPHQPGQDRESAKPAKKDVEPPVPHGERHAPFGVASNTEIARRQCQQPVGNDTRVIRQRNFGKHAKLAWAKPAATMAAIAGVSERHAARWLSGEFDAPGCVYAALMVEIAK